jgi:hypothetical protein
MEALGQGCPSTSGGNRPVRGQAKPAQTSCLVIAAALNQQVRQTQGHSRVVGVKAGAQTFEVAALSQQRGELHSGMRGGAGMSAQFRLGLVQDRSRSAGAVPQTADR